MTRCSLARSFARDDNRSLQRHARLRTAVGRSSRSLSPAVVGLFEPRRPVAPRHLFLDFFCRGRPERKGLRLLSFRKEIGSGTADWFERHVCFASPCWPAYRPVSRRQGHCTSGCRRDPCTALRMRPGTLWRRQRKKDELACACRWETRIVILRGVERGAHYTITVFI